MMVARNVVKQDWREMKRIYKRFKTELSLTGPTPEEREKSYEGCVMQVFTGVINPCTLVGIIKSTSCWEIHEGTHHVALDAISGLWTSRFISFWKYVSLNKNGVFAMQWILLKIFCRMSVVK